MRGSQELFLSCCFARPPLAASGPQLEYDMLSCLTAIVVNIDRASPIFTQSTLVQRKLWYCFVSTRHVSPVDTLLGKAMLPCISFSLFSGIVTKTQDVWTPISGGQQ